MTTNIDSDSLDLARTIATRAGMLFEDGSVKVILVGGLGAEDLRSCASEARAMIEQADIYLRAVETLLDGQEPCAIIDGPFGS